MSELRVNHIVAEGGTSAPSFKYGFEVPVGYGITVAGGINITGVLTCSSYAGDVTGDVTGDLTGTASTATAAANAYGITGKPNVTLDLVTADDIVVGGALTVTGNMTVDGTQTIINTSTLDVADKTVGLGSTSAATNTTAAGAGVEIYASSATANNNKTLLWQNTSNCWEFSHQIKPKGVLETVSSATTYLAANGSVVVELDCQAATTYKYTIPAVSLAGAGANIGIVSFKNVAANAAGGQTITLITDQGGAHGGATGFGNTVATNGIGNTCTIIPISGGSAVAGISTRAKVGGGTTITLSPALGAVDIISFFVDYNGGTNTALTSYKVYAVKNGNYIWGLHGV